MSKDYWWGWLDEDGNKVALVYGDINRYNFEQAERVHNPSEIPVDVLLEYLQSEASNANRHHMVDGYRRLVKILKSNLHEDNVKTILHKIIEAGGIHDE